MRSTQITFLRLISLGFRFHNLKPLILRKGKLFVTCWSGTWQICDQEGRVGNEGNYNNIEELLKRVNI